MIPWRLAAAGLALAAAAPVAPDSARGEYRVRIPVVPGAGSVVQRLVVPAAALAAAQTPDLADLRIVDARGRAMPIARVAAAPNLRRHMLAAMPILGAADDLQVRGVSLRLDHDGRARVARVDGIVTAGPDRSAVLGVLFDARAASGAARALALDADVPEGQPVTFTVEASRDLAEWRTLGERVSYRAPGSASTDASVPLGSAPVEGDYLRVTWRTASRTLSPVRVRRAALLTRPDGAAAQIYADAAPPPPRDPHAIEFTLPFRTPVATLRIVPAGDDLVVPVRILGRDTAEQPWMPIGEGVAARPAGDRATPGLALERSFRTLRIEADARTPGFTTPPTLRFGFAGRELLFLAAGAAPFTLVAGQAGLSDTYLPPDSLLTQAAGKAVATAEAEAGPARVTLAEPGDPGAIRRHWLLWAVLLLAVGVLAALAIALIRRNAADVPSQEDGTSIG